jgi:beta-phosphoglucomutase
MAQPIQAVLFDFDGTLVDSEPLHYDCWMQAVRPFGGGMDWPQYNARFTGRSDYNAGQTLLQEAGHDPTEAIIRQVLEDKRRAFNSRFRQELSIGSDIRQWITQPSNKLLLAVVSSSHRSEVEPLLDQEGILSRLAVIVCGDDVQRHKPNPEPYRLAFQRLAKTNGQIQVKNCLAIEDSEAGAESAQAAGMKVCKVSAPSEVRAVLDLETGIARQ